MLKTKKSSRVLSLLLGMLLAIGVVTSTAITAFAATGSLTIYKLADEGLTFAEVSAIAQNEIDAGNYSGKAADYIAKFYYKKTDGSTTTYHKYLSGATYTIYKIGTMKQSTSASSNNSTVNMVYAPISGLKDKAGSSITVLNSSTDADNINTSGLTAVDSKTTGADGIIKFSGLGDNTVYLVVETSTPAGVTKVNNFIVSVPYYDATDGWINDITAYPKNAKNDAAISKVTTAGTVLDTDSKETASFGSTIGYKVSATVPSDIDTAGYTQFDIVDIPSTYLTIDSASITVYLNGTAAGDLLKKGTDYVLDYSSGKLTIKFVDSTLSSTNLTDLLDGGNEIFVTYNAKIAALVPSDVKTITNDIQIQYKTDGGPGTTDPDPDPKPVIYLYNYSLKKVDDASTPSPLANAAFAMYRLDGTTKQYLTYSSTGGWGTSANIRDAHTITSGSNGLVQFIGLAYGEYYITETAAPDGYTLLTNDIKVTIDGTTTAAYINEAADVSGNIAPQYKGYSITVVNAKATGSLPTTGGNGIYLFLIIGGALVVTALVLYAISRKKNNVA